MRDPEFGIVASGGLGRNRTFNLANVIATRLGTIEHGFNPVPQAAGRLSNFAQDRFPNLEQVRGIKFGNRQPATDNRQLCNCPFCATGTIGDCLNRSTNQL
jgi:hypothetical protein